MCANVMKLMRHAESLDDSPWRAKEDIYFLLTDCNVQHASADGLDSTSLAEITVTLALASENLHVDLNLIMTQNWFCRTD
jgi:hypothetical protein